MSNITIENIHPTIFSCAQPSAICLMCEPYPKRWLIPQHVFCLPHPPLARLLKFYIEVPEHTRQNRTQFKVRKPRPGDVREATDAIHVIRLMRKTLTSSRYSLEGPMKRVAARPRHRRGNWQVD